MLPGEGGFGVDPAVVRPGEDELCCGVWSDSRLVEQLWCELAGKRLDLVCELAFLGSELQDPARDRAEREEAATHFRSCLPAGRVAARRCSSLAAVSGRSSLRSGAPVW